MAVLLNTFRQKAGDLISAINDRGGIRATIEALRRQMAEADRRRTIGKVKAELRRLDGQITEMITAVGVQAVGLHKAGMLHSTELQPLCAHIVELEAALAEQKSELATLEAAMHVATAGDPSTCPSCGKPLIEGATFCAHCGSPVPEHQEMRFCPHCGSALRRGARFCQRCGQAVGAAPSS